MYILQRMRLLGLLGLHNNACAFKAHFLERKARRQKNDGCGLMKPRPWDRTNSPHAAVVDVGVGRGSPAGSVSDGESRPMTVLGSNPQSFLPSSRQQLHAGKMVAEGDLASARQRHENKQNPEEDALAPGEEDVMEKSDTPMISLLKNGTVNATRSSLDWEGAGGEYGLSAEWREAISIRDGEGEGGGGGINTSLRGEACMAEESQAGVQEILDRRRTIPPTKKVVACVRTKDYGRFLPEWIAFHYAAGVDQITVYDDDSVDNTEAFLQPFVKAGIVQYISSTIKSRQKQMGPLNDCLRTHMEQRRKPGGSISPRWLLFHDTDEYLYPIDTNLTIPQALENHEDICCVLVPRVQYGSAGHDEMPQGLMLEEFLFHATKTQNPKIMVNLDPVMPELGTVDFPLISMHNAKGCKCKRLADLRINHYLGSIGDYMDRTSRYWEDKVRGHMSPENNVLRRDINVLRSDDIVHWACATREILYRIAQGLDLDSEAPALTTSATPIV